MTRTRESGAALIVVLVLTVIIAGASGAFIWFMNQQQTRAGARLRSAAALGAAEAGVHRALSVLESTGADGRSPGRIWRPSAHTEGVAVGALQGRYTISIADAPGGAVVITSTGNVGGIIRRLRVRAYLASPALLAALHGASFVRIEQPPAATFILPYGAGIGDRPWIHIAAGREIWFATTDVSINNPDAPLAGAPGPADGPAAPNSATAVGRPGPVRLLIARGGEVTLGAAHERVDLDQLRATGVYVEGVVLRTEALPPLPEVDRDYYRSLAAANATNALMNEAAGKYVGDADLALKRDSVYTRTEFEQLQAYFKSGLALPRLRGVIYVSGGIVLVEDRRLEIADGALVTEGTVRLGEGASLDVTHTAATRTLPGLIVLDSGALFVSGDAHLRAHGLVYASRVIDIKEGARADIVGAVLGNDAGLSFRNTGGTVVIRYDPAVLGTPGLRVADQDPVVAWVAAWEELP